MPGEKEVTQTPSYQTPTGALPSVSIPQITITPPDIKLPTLPPLKTVSSITLNEEQINELIDMAIKDNPKFENPYVSLSGDIMTVTATVKLAIVTGKVSARATIKTENSVVKVDLTEVKLGGIRMPKFLVSPVETEINKLLNDTLNKIPGLEIEEIYVQNSLLTIKGSIPTGNFWPF
jgi:hypothetical protein